jgi:chitodextrinase
MWGAAPRNSRLPLAIASLIALVVATPVSARFGAVSSANAATAAATITNVSPMSGSVGSKVTITGTNFVGVSNVTFYDYPTAGWTVNSPTSITAVVPYGTRSPGRWRVITTAGTAVYDPLFTITGTPTLTSVSPMSGAVGSEVTLTGSNFANVTNVTFYDSPSPSWRLNSPTSITAVVPYGTPSPGRWRVVNPAYTAVYSPTFTVTGTPTISSVTPMSGPVGSTVTISGSNFANVTKVSFYDYPAASFKVNSSGSITATVPSGTPSPGRWRVVNPAYTTVYSPLFSVGPDVTAPTTPSGLAVTSAGATTLSLSWNASSDNVGVTGYGVYRNGTLAASVSGTSFNISNLPCSTTATYEVDAVDGAGNRSTKAGLTASTAACSTSGIRWRFAYSNRLDQGLMPQYGFNLIDVSTKSEADATPPGTQGQLWLYDYDNTTCSWEKDDTYVRNMVSSVANDPKVAGFYFSNEPDPFACPNAPQQHKDRNALIKSLAPTKYTLIGIDANWREHFDQYGTMWRGAADYVNYNPYICYVGAPCDFAWEDHVLQVAQSLGQPFFVALQAFKEGTEWRWPTAAEETQMLDRLKDPSLTNLAGYLTFSWDWQNDPLLNHPDVLGAIQNFNLGVSAPAADTAAPTVPTGLAATASTATSVSLGWNSSSDNVAVAGYGVYRNGTLIATTLGTSYTVAALSCGTSYTFSVDAYDAAGNRSGQVSLSAATSVCGDTVAPSAPTGLKATAATATSVSISWSAASDNVGVAGYGVYRGGTLVASTAGTNYTLGGLTCGSSYSIGVDAYDAAGNRSQPASLTVATSPCDTSAPTTPTLPTVSGTTQTSITLNWGASLDNVAVAGYDVFRDGTKVGSVTTTSYTYTTLNCGTGYTLGVEAYDAAGNRSTRATLNASTSSCPTPPPPSSSDPVIAAAGDICSSPTDCGPTATLLDQIAPTRVLTLGDNAYPDGTASDYSSYYDPNWGRQKAKTSPAPGNHDYHTANGAGYFAYFGPQAPAPYYSFDLGSWHLISLNGEIDHSNGSSQETWLKNDLAAHPAQCTLAYWHEPRFSSGAEHGSDTSFAPFWNDLYNAGADIVLNGHDHEYERFAPQNPTATPDPKGIREFVVGTGGASHYTFTTPIANSEVRDNTSYGVLKLTLHTTSYDWQFVPVAGATFTDTGTTTCH